MVYIVPLETDGLDNDGDGEIDEAGGEGSIVPNNTTTSRQAGSVITAFAHSDALLRIDAGESVTFYYRVDPDNRYGAKPAAASRQPTRPTIASRTNRAASRTPLGRTASSVVHGSIRRHDAGHDRRPFRSSVPPKTILQTLEYANSELPGMPAARLDRRGGRVRAAHADPGGSASQLLHCRHAAAGMSCVEAPDVDLDAPPYDAAGFVPGRAIHPDRVMARFSGTSATSASRRRIATIAVSISACSSSRGSTMLPQNQDGLVIGNGGDYTRPSSATQTKLVIVLD